MPLRRRTRREPGCRRKRLWRAAVLLCFRAVESEADFFGRSWSTFLDRRTLNGAPHGGAAARAGSPSIHFLESTESAESTSRTPDTAWSLESCITTRMLRPVHQIGRPFASSSCQSRLALFRRPIWPCAGPLHCQPCILQESKRMHGLGIALTSRGAG